MKVGWIRFASTYSSKQRCQACRPSSRPSRHARLRLSQIGAGLLVALPRRTVHRRTYFLTASAMVMRCHGAFQVDDLPLIGDRRSCRRRLERHRLVELLDQIHDVVDNPHRPDTVSTVREFRVVAWRPCPRCGRFGRPRTRLLKAADNQALQVQLGLNAQEHGDVQRVVVRDGTDARMRRFPRCAARACPLPDSRGRRGTRAAAAMMLAALA